MILPPPSVLHRLRSLYRQASWRERRPSRPRLRQRHRDMLRCRLASGVCAYTRASTMRDIGVVGFRNVKKMSLEHVASNVEAVRRVQTSHSSTPKIDMPTPTTHEDIQYL